MPSCSMSILLACVLAWCVLQGSGSWTTRENAKAGSRDWWQPQSALAPDIEGFSTSFSLYPGQSVKFKIACNSRSANYSLEIYRLGFYGGLGGRIMAKMAIPSAACSRQPVCHWTAATRMTDCSNWKESVAWEIPTDAPSGVYLALPTDRATRTFGGYIPFVVKQPLHAAGADILFKTSDMTWVAYNKYGGWNLYGANHSKDFSTRAFAASYNRPFANRLTYPIGQQQNFVLGTEFPMLYWLEKFGYDVAYCGCADVETLSDAGLLSAYKVWLSVGHDEYWTPEMKTAFLSAREQGVHLAFFSGNEIFWRVVWEETYLSKLPGASPAPSSDARRVIYCRKESIENISAPHLELWTGTFVDPRHQPYPDPENSLTGQRFLVNSYRNDSLTASVEDLELRFWRNTSHLFNRTRKLSGYRSPPGVLGYEWDVFVDDVFRPSGLFLLSSTTLRISNQLCEHFGASYRGSGVAQHRLVLYRHHRPPLSPPGLSFSSINASCANLSASPSSSSSHSSPSFPSSSAAGLVFGAGTIQWAWALSSFRDGDPMPVDATLQQATLNLLADMSVSPAAVLRTSRGTLQVGDDTMPELVYPQPSRDLSPPQSRIVSPVGMDPSKASSVAMSRLVHRHGVLKIRGTARDTGGGRVAAVEVSIDGGKTWHLANGRQRWRLDFHWKPSSSSFSVSSSSSSSTIGGRALGFSEPSDSYDTVLHNVTGFTYQLRESLMHDRRLFREHADKGMLSGSRGGEAAGRGDGEGAAAKDQVMVILSRAVDDSGNLESVPLDHVLCKVWRRDWSLAGDMENVVFHRLEGDG